MKLFLFTQFWWYWKQICFFFLVWWRFNYFDSFQGSIFSFNTSEENGRVSELCVCVNHSEVKLRIVATMFWLLKINFISILASKLIKRTPIWEEFTGFIHCTILTILAVNSWDGGRGEVFEPTTLLCHIFHLF